MINTLTILRIIKHFLLLNGIFLILNIGVIKITYAEENSIDEFPWEIFYPAFIKNSNNLGPQTPPCGIPSWIAVPSSSTTGNYTVSWGPSVTNAATYVLEEATNTIFTTGLRLAYRGTGRSVSITGRSNGTTYYYRVKAIANGFSDSAWRIGNNGCTVNISSACANIAGTWNASEKSTVTCCMDGYCETENFNGIGTVSIQQMGCNVSYSIYVNGYGYVARKGTISGNTIKLSGKFVILEPEFGCTETKNIVYLNGTVNGNQINLKGSGAFNGTCDGYSLSCNGSSTAIFSRLKDSLGSTEATIEKNSTGEFSEPIFNDCVKIFSVIVP